MKILILGADGMLGHQLTNSLKWKHEVVGSVRQNRSTYAEIANYLPDNTYYGVDVRNFDGVLGLLKKIRPDAVVNAVGIVKQRKEAKEAILSLEVNALLPHRLSQSCSEINARFIQISTDCVFSGRQGMYKENDFADADDLYGRSKFLGEVSGEGSVTLRTSIIGIELSRKKSLVEWFLAQPGPIKGFSKAIYSGFTTMEMARIIENVLVLHPGKNGLYHVSSTPIDKYSLLTMLRDRLRRPVEILLDDEFVCDRSMDSSRFQVEFKYTPPSWAAMLDELSVEIKERYQC